MLERGLEDEEEEVHPLRSRFFVPQQPADASLISATVYRFIGDQTLQG
jgi:hypothetical protein